ncbi:MAG: HD domain-containing protein [Lachnospiraceae bacterium]|nr:HD domain-containing protein [Lachnospiraceae bacterium]
MLSDSRQKRKGILNPAVLGFMALATGVNIFLSMLIRPSGLPFYMDTIGTVTVTALGGAVPGIVVAFATNTINFFLDGESVFYAPLNMLIAILSAAYFGEYSRYRKNELKKRRESLDRFATVGFQDLILFIVTLSFVGGVLGGAITWYLYRTPSDNPLTVSLSNWLAEKMGLSEFACHMVATFAMDFIDKSISVIISLLIITLAPKKLKKAVKLSSWRQNPLTIEQQRKAKEKRHGKISIGTRINLIIIASTMLMTTIALAFSAVNYRDTAIETLSGSAYQVAYLAANEINPEKVNDYLKFGPLADGYTQTAGRLRVIKNSLPDITFLYVYKFDKRGCHVVFDLDAVLSDGTYVEGDAPGQIIDVEEDFLPYLNDILDGNPIPVIRIKDEYGSFFAAYYPVYDVNGNCVCYVGSNVETALVNDLLYNYFGRVLLLFIGFHILVIAISIITTKYNIVMPITSITLYANELADTVTGATEENLEKIEELDIHTGDEIEQLYKAFCNMTAETVYRLNENQKKTEAIAKMQNALIITMADMVETRDSDTGAHVIKTSAYVRIILQGLRKNGYYAEKISDRFMRDVEMSAPLHDVGKIYIPDAILNKEGKLTEEEFEIMKTHTTAGRNILENAISSMEGDNYLKEARNMAAYHHERWDGKGYPEGLHGEVIPLSARIMAVADVFDALSSARVYKPPYTFDEAINLIKDGAGTQFDPKCVEVFLESISEVKKIYRKYQESQ